MIYINIYHNKIYGLFCGNDNLFQIRVHWRFGILGAPNFFTNFGFLMSWFSMLVILTLSTREFQDLYEFCPWSRRIREERVNYYFNKTLVKEVMV